MEQETKQETIESEKAKMSPPRAKNAKRAWKDLIRFCKPWYAATAIAFIFAMTATVLQLLGPGFVEDMVENIMMGDHDSVVSIGFTLVIIYGIMFTLSYTQQLIMAGVTQRIALRLRRKISGKINKLPFSYYDKTPTGDVLSRITNDVDTVSQTLNYSIVTLIAATTMVVGAAVFMFVTNWLLALVAIGSSFVGFFLMAVIMMRSQKYFIAQQKELGDVNAHIEEYYGGHTVMKTSNAVPQVTRRFDKLNNNLYKSAWKSQFYSGLMMPIMTFLGQFSFVAICVVGGALVFSGSIGFPIIASFMIYVRLFSFTLVDIAEAMQNLQRTAASSERVFEFLNEKEMPDESSLNGKLENIKGEVIFNDLKFGYEDGIDVIKGFSANIPAGSKVAIVGPTGAGKTTLVNLLMKFYNSKSGDIRIDGVSIHDLKRGEVSSLFGMVLQDTWLFEGTVRENLLYNMKIDKEREKEILERATQAAGIDHFIRTLPKGFDTVLNDNTSVSNGQKQLLTIARAMIKDAPLLILDEATSSVDTRTEILIQDAMDKLTKGHTSFIIAHRLSTIKNADVILVMNHGDIVESGKHEELLTKNGFYAELYNSQFADAS